MFRPPVKMGRSMRGENAQVPEPAVNRFDSSVEAVPTEAVSEIDGKNAARAAPMLALAALSWCSAERMSGRRCRRSEGRPAGSSATGGCCSSGAAAGRSFGSGPPASSTSAFSACASACR
ncbi:hypothetical protein PSR1_03322 [Anaeromyxobacter sp. PSR-1]|nr:hypothetical protein PSR1_03322 [Anaeromyxobacter sp. PSR-1]